MGDTLPYGFHRSFRVMAKPIGSLCNLDCSYCYYLHKEQLLADSSKSKMQADVLEAYIKQYIQSQDVETVNFCWHGGEPTLMGLEFFRKVVRLQQTYASGKVMNNSVQTNGTLLDDEWCRFFKENDFLVGVSIDGPKWLHDEYRVSKSGKPTFDEVIRGLDLLKKHEIRFPVLCVVNRLNAKYPAEVYNFFVQELGARTIHLLPCVEPKDYCSTAPHYWDKSKLPVIGSRGARPGNPESIVTEWSVDADDWGNFLCRTFDIWMERDRGQVAVTWFESLLRQRAGDQAVMCVLAEVCGHAVAMEKDGSIYSCDHYVYPEYRLGNIREDDLSTMLYSAKQRRFGCNKRDTLPKYCRACEYRSLCNGECPKNRLIKTEDGEVGLNYLCSGLKKFFSHAVARLDEISTLSA